MAGSLTTSQLVVQLVTQPVYGKDRNFMKLQGSRIMAAEVTTGVARTGRQRVMPMRHRCRSHVRSANGPFRPNGHAVIASQKFQDNIKHADQDISRRRRAHRHRKLTAVAQQ
jgi:hypothetical protein